MLAILAGESVEKRMAKINNEYDDVVKQAKVIICNNIKYIKLNP